MTATRVAAAIAAVVTALLLQATLVAPVTLPVPVSLPAVLVAAVALCSGPGTGMTLGFSAGLLADLGSAHPAGVLALAWLALGLGCGALADPRRGLRRRVLAAALACGLVTAAVTVLLAMLGDAGATVPSALRELVPAMVGDGVLAAVIVPCARRFLRSPALRAARVPRDREVRAGG